MLDGKPESERTTDELWNDTLKRMACFTTCQVPIKKGWILSKIKIKTNKNYKQIFLIQKYFLSTNILLKNTIYFKIK